jgi:aryl-alcohol dehydrogenase-like predicted oxidoreductase
VFQPGSDDINARRRAARRAGAGSLAWAPIVDVLFLHQFDRRTPIEEQMRALEDVVSSGKVLYPAVSNYAAWQVQQALGIQERQGWARLQVIQPMYNLVKRQAEVEILPMAQANGVGVIPYSPARRLLSGKYSGQATGRLKTNKMYEARYGEEWVFEVAEKFVAYCAARNLNPVATAVACGRPPGVTAPITARATSSSCAIRWPR